MQELIIHLLKSAGLLSLFFAAYYFLLKNDTSFKSNRIFLLAGIITSVFLPFLEITRSVTVKNTVTPVLFQDFSNVQVSAVTAQANEIDWWQIAGVIYLLGLGFFLLKFLIELSLLLKLIITHKITKEGEFYIIQKCGNNQPFSFFKFIVFDPDQHTPTEQELILRHERCHARQWHSIDQLLTSLSVYLLWFNPLAWMYRKIVVQNLEYLADKEVIKAEVSKKEYQKTLLKIAVGNIQPALTNQFYQSFIKKRIIMLNKNATQKSNFWKTSLLLPFLLLFIFSFNIKTEAREIPDQENTMTSKDEISVYVTKDSDEESLRAHERAFKEHGIDLKFDNLQFSQGLLTKITASFTKKSTGTSGNLTLTNTKGISPLLIHTDGEQVTMTPTDAVPGKLKGAGTIKKEKNGSGAISKTEDHKFQADPDDIIAIQSNESGTTALTFQEEKPLIVVGGKIQEKDFNLNSIEPQTIKSLNVLKGESATEKYGKRAENGAIEIILKTDAEILQEKKEQNKNQENRKEQNFKSESVSFKISEKLNGKSSQVKVINVDEAKLSESNALFVVDGKEMDKDFDPDSIDPNKIQSISVLKGPKAIEKYGEKAGEGLIIITTKK